MTLEELNQVERDRSDAKRSAENIKYAATQLAVLRNGDRSLLEIIYDVNKRDSYGSSKLMSKELNSAINDMKVDIMRIAELRLEAMARQQSTRAAALKGQLDAYLSELAKEPL